VVVDLGGAYWLGAELAGKLHSMNELPAPRADNNAFAAWEDPKISLYSSGN